MASASSSSMASPTVDGSNYDVFLSFSRKDTRNTFTDHLYVALGRAGLRSFKFNDEIDRDQAKQEIERVIKESRASIVVLSENYATSTWCLDELLLILEQRREHNQFVLAVFYHIDPSDVWEMNKKLKIQVQNSSRWTEDNVNRWKIALTKVADLPSLVVSGCRPETEFLKKIVDTIYKELDGKVYLPPNLTGMVARYEEIKSWLDQSNFEFLAICGMGGSGKTTLAKYIYHLNRRDFENTSFLEDIGRKYKKPNGVLELMKQFHKDITGGSKRKIPRSSQRMSKIEEALQTKKMLIVLDDITEHSQLTTLLGSGMINPQSKVIITTNLRTDGWFKFLSYSCQQHEMILLKEDESLELLSLNAFGSKIPMEGFKELAVQAIRYCEGNPLAVKVFGSSLSKSNNIQFWERQLKVLERDIHPQIQDVLKRSYDLLPLDSHRELFLHICFFIGKDVDFVVDLLDYDCSAESGINVLINRDLLSISSSKKLVMHRLLQEMGKCIVYQGKSESYNLETMSKSKAFVSNETKESASIPHEVKSKSVVTNEVRKKIVLKVNFTNDKEKRKVMKHVVGVVGVESISVDSEEGKLTVAGDVDVMEVVKCVRKTGLHTELISVGPFKEHKEEVALAQEPPKEHQAEVVLTPEQTPTTFPFLRLQY